MPLKDQNNITKPNKTQIKSILEEVNDQNRNLIEQFAFSLAGGNNMLVSVGQNEQAGTKVKDSNFRIDLQGNFNDVNTGARTANFQLQTGNVTLAVLKMRAGRTFTQQQVVNGFTLSLKSEGTQCFELS